MKYRIWTRLPSLALRACLLLAAWTAPVRSAPRTSWHHPNSPYRAEFRIASRPANPRGGLAVSVPVCGLGDEDGADLFAYDSRTGRQLSLLPLGRSAGNEAIALVEVPDEGDRVCVYFGSKARAPVNRRAFLPSLTADVRTLPEGPGDNPPQVLKLLEQSQRLGKVFVDKIELSYNPVDATDGCIIVFEGQLDIPRAGTYTFMLVSDDAGYLYIDDELLIERNGRHYPGDAVRGENRKDVRLTAGLHPIRCILVDFAGDLMCVVARWEDEKRKYPLPPDSFLQPGKTEKLTVEARYADAPLPAFSYREVSYMSYADVPYTEVELATYNGKSARWQFGDGGELSGATVRRVIPGLRGMKVRCRQGNEEGSGRIDISELPPPQHAMTNSRAFDQYSGLLTAPGVDKLSEETLSSTIAFLGYIEQNPALVPACEALLNLRPNRETRAKTLLLLARAAAADSPDTARKAYRALLKEDGDAAAAESRVRETVEFLLFRTREFDRAEEEIARYEGNVKTKDSPAVLSMRIDLALQQGKTDEAKQLLDKLMGRRDIGENQRLAAVKANALRERFYDLLRERFLSDARDVLREWETIAPMDRLTGSFPLARSRLWQTFGWHDGALGELEAAVLLNPILPNLPDVEYEQAKVIIRAGDEARGMEMLRRIVEAYPNHPTTEKVREQLK